MSNKVIKLVKFIDNLPSKNNTKLCHQCDNYCQEYIYCKYCSNFLCKVCYYPSLDNMPVCEKCYVLHQGV